MKTIIVCGFLLFSLSQAAASTLGPARWAMTEWEGLTNADGTGLFVEVVEQAFAHSGIEVVLDVMPWRRALHSVENSKADFTGGVDRSERYHQSAYPISEVEDCAFFHQDLIEDWSGLPSLSGYRGTWALGYLDSVPDDVTRYLQGVGVERESALQMVLQGRADYYFDNRSQLMQTIANSEHSEQLDLSDYRIESIMTMPLYMSFSPDERGRQLRDLFDQGMAALLRSGELAEIYARWNEPMPTMPVIPAP